MFLDTRRTDAFISEDRIEGSGEEVKKGGGGREGEKESFFRSGGWEKASNF